MTQKQKVSYIPMIVNKRKRKKKVENIPIIVPWSTPEGGGMVESSSCSFRNK